jgi:hypothetical protein
VHTQCHQAVLSDRKLTSGCLLNLYFPEMLHLLTR